MSKSERLRKRFLTYAKKLEKTQPALAKRIQEKVDDLVNWYVKNRRDMTPQEFDQILRDVAEVELADRLNEGHE